MGALPRDWPVVVTVRKGRMLLERKQGNGAVYHPNIGQNEHVYLDQKQLPNIELFLPM